MIDAAAFARMKQGAIFITTARGGIHNEAALADALASGHLAGAGLDVWDVEPPPLDHPLLKMDNVVATYHTAGVTPEARAAMGSYAADQIIDLLTGGYPPRLLNPKHGRDTRNASRPSWSGTRSTTSGLYVVTGFELSPDHAAAANVKARRIRSWSRPDHTWFDPDNTP